MEASVAGGFGLRHESRAIRIEAVRTASDGERPCAGRGHRWELRCRQSVGEASSVRTLCVVEARSEAIEALYDRAERIAAGGPARSTESTRRTATGSAHGRIREPNL